MPTLDKAGQELLFTEARSYSFWQDKKIDEALLRQLHDLCKWGPTSSNCCPMRVVFVVSQEAKEKLKSCLAKGNVEKSMSAAAVAIIGMDMAFYELLPRLFPHTDARSWFVGNEQLIKDTAFRNSSLQGAYFMLAARALGLDCGPMSGFDNAKMDETFFKGTTIKSNFICALGYGDKSKLYPRGPRLAFDEVCKVV